MKIVTILGARPQFIKAGSVSREINHQISLGKNISETLIHTGQHYDENMSDIFFEEMHLPKPNYKLEIGGKTHGAMTGQMIHEIENILFQEKPDTVVVYGDTNTTLAGAIASAKLHIPIAHVEAGLRSFNMQMPEEINRILTDRISKILFCPTLAAKKNLENEGFSHWNTSSKLLISGDVMLDGALYYAGFSEKPASIDCDNEFILSTIHRAENTNNKIRLKGIVSALNELGKSKKIIFPVHPRTKKIISEENFDISNIEIIDPVGYFNMIWLINHCSIIMTDSGGLQKEAFFFKKPCITLRDQTEWVELVDLKVNFLAGADRGNILTVYSELNNMIDFNNFNLELYGNGQASKLIVEELLNAK